MAYLFNYNYELQITETRVSNDQFSDAHDELYPKIDGGRLSMPYCSMPI